MNVQTPVANATSVQTRPRAPRAVDVVSVAPAIPTYETALVEFIRANTAKNKATQQEGKAKKSLEKAMTEANVASFRMKVDDIMREAKIAPYTQDVVDIAALYGKVDLEVFLSIVSASHGAVKDKCGSALLASVIKTIDKDATLTVKKAD